MRLVLLVALALAFTGVAIDATPAASACTSDPAILCAVINAIGECGSNWEIKYPTTIVKNCLP